LKQELEARGINSKEWTSASGRITGGKPFSRGALYLILRNRTYLGEIVHNGRSHPGEHPPIIDQPLWDTVQAQLASNTAERNASSRTRQPSLLAGMLFDGSGNAMTPTHAVKKGTHYRYYVSRPLITKDRSDGSAGLRLPAEAIEQLVTGRVRRWLLDPGSIYPVTHANASALRRLIACAAEIGKSWPQLSATRQRALLAGLVERIDIGANQIDIHVRATQLGALFDGPAVPLVDEANDETQILSVPVRLHQSGSQAFTAAAARSCSASSWARRRALRMTERSSAPLPQRVSLKCTSGRPGRGIAFCRSAMAGAVGRRCLRPNCRRAPTRQWPPFPSS